MRSIVGRFIHVPAATQYIYLPYAIQSEQPQLKLLDQICSQYCNMYAVSLEVDNMLMYDIM